MDKRAGQYPEYIKASTTYEYSKLLLHSIWKCTLNTTIIIENVDNQVKDRIYREQMMKYLMDR